MALHGAFFSNADDDGGVLLPLNESMRIHLDVSRCLGGSYPRHAISVMAMKCIVMIAEFGIESCLDDGIDRSFRAFIVYHLIFHAMRINNISIYADGFMLESRRLLIYRVILSGRTRMAPSHKAIGLSVC